MRGGDYMIFNTLYESSKRGELLLVDGGMCHWHLRRDGQLTIREIISTKPGSGNRMLEVLKATTGAICIIAKCPVNLESNAWYERRGFRVDRVEMTRGGKPINVWRLDLQHDD